MNILQAIDDPDLFASGFADRATWAAWRAFLAALFGLPMSPDQLTLFTQCTGRSIAPLVAAREAWLACGRRAGKSYILALIAVYLAVARDYAQCLAPGERATILILAADRKQSRVIFRYVAALLKGVPMLARMIENERAESFDLTTRVTIEVGTNNYRSVRGYAFAAVLCDEIAFWRSDDSASPDYEVLTAVKPGMATIPGAMLLCASSPYARRGALYDAHQKHHGKDGPVLVWQAATRTMNPTVPQSFIDEEMERDPAKTRAEYLAEFRTDIERFITIEAVEACIEFGIRERAPERHWHYFAFVDPSGGSGDAFTLVIGHLDGDRVLIDCIREVPSPFSPEQVVAEFAQTCKSYRITKVTGDNFGGEWPKEAFRKHGIAYERSDKPKSQLYQALLPLINSSRILLLDNDRLLHELVGLERRTARGGRDTIDHSPGGHDDVANAVAGVGAYLAAQPPDHGWAALVAKCFQHEPSGDANAA